MENQTVTKPRPLSGLTNKDLLNRLREAGKENISTDHHAEFYYRFKDDVYSICHNVCTYHRMEIHEKDIFQETFAKGLRAIGNMKILETATDNQIAKKILAYLATTARNSLYDILRKRIKDREIQAEITIPEARDDPDAFTAEEFENLPLTRQVLQEALEKLSDIQRYVLMNYADYYCLNLKSDPLGLSEIEDQDIKKSTKKKIRKLPPSVVKRLCTELNISEDHLRVIKNRAIKKVIEHIKKYNFKS